MYFDDTFDYRNTSISFNVPDVSYDASQPNEDNFIENQESIHTEKRSPPSIICPVIRSISLSLQGDTQVTSSNIICKKHGGTPSDDDTVSGDEGAAPSHYINHIAAPPTRLPVSFNGKTYQAITD